MKTRFFYIIIAALIILGCSKNNKPSPAPPSIKEISISLNYDTVYTGTRSSIEIVVSVPDKTNMKELVVTKEAANNSFVPVNTIPAGEIKSGEIRYTYNFASNDNEKFQISFIPVGIDNKRYGAKKILIDRRTGLFPVSLFRLSRLTGASLWDERFPNPTPTSNWSVGGTDLGIMWDMGNGKTGIFFGDTYGNDFKPVSNGGPGGAGQWRYNVLAFSEDKNLDDGLSLSGMATVAGNASFARQIMDRHPGSHTAIPAGAIHINGVDYVHYWNLQTWDNFVTNFASLYKSTDHGLTWSRCTEITYGPRSKFTCAAYAKKDGYVYLISTKVIRDDVPYLARVTESDILKKDNYEYWNGTSWVRGNEDAATPVFNGPMGEASLQYNLVHKVWMLTYLGKPDIEIRYAKNVTGPWSKPRILVKAAEYPGLYGAFMHPVSDGNVIYFNMSMWWPYNVFFMKANLKYIEP